MTHRIADHPIESFFLERWSPRDFDSAPIPDDALARLFEAARWTPSSSNLQPWRFLHAKRDTADWPLFFDVLKEGNRGWAAGAAVLIALLSKRTAPVRGSDAVRENYNHSFDTGAAWMALALQASAMGWAAHAMGGIDVPRAIAVLRVPDDYRVECMIAVGRPAVGTAATLKARAPQTDFVRAGPFPRRDGP